MKQTERQTRSHLMKLLEQQGINPRHHLGQNFLIDLNLVDYIVEEAHLGPDDVVLEVGAGTGGMTAQLCERAGHVVSVELDTRMIPLAQAAVAGRENVTLLNCDALRNKNHLATEVLDAVGAALDRDEGLKLKLISNLPYAIATPVISNLVASELPWVRMVVTIQLELAQRIVAKPGRKHYSGLSVWMQSQCRVKLLKRLPPAVFWPRPKVNSAIVLIKPEPNWRAKIADRPFLQDFVRRLFHQRRKLMRGVLVGAYRKQLSKPETDALIAQAGLDGSVRAEALAPHELVGLANLFHAAISSKGADNSPAERADQPAHSAVVDIDGFDAPSIEGQTITGEEE